MENNKELDYLNKIKEQEIVINALTNQLICNSIFKNQEAIDNYIISIKVINKFKVENKIILDNVVNNKIILDNSEIKKEIEQTIEQGQLSYDNSDSFFSLLKDTLIKENLLTEEDDEILEKIESIEVIDKILGE